MTNSLNNIFIIIILYSIWALGLELLSKKYSQCECLSLQTYIFAGTIASIFLFFHIKKGCNHYKNISDITKTPIKVLLCIVIISIAIVWANRAWYKAVNKTNSGFVSALTSSYIILVAIISAHMYRTKIKMSQYIGIGSIITGCYLLSK
jgi:uncharacterized membrane protein